MRSKKFFISKKRFFTYKSHYLLNCTQRILQDTYFFPVLGVIILSFILRFYDYPRRWGLAYDQARDTIVTFEALKRGAIPLTGPFSASGQFVFGPLWYWFNILVTAISPSNPMTLWIFQALLSSLMPLVMFLIGKDLKDKKLGLILAIITAISTARIAQATNLTYSTAVGMIEIFILFFLIRAMKEGNKIYAFFSALLIGVSLNVHFQSAGNLLLIFPLIFAQRKSIAGIILVFAGFILPFTPLIIFDFLFDHFESRHILEYLFPQSYVYHVPKRWLTYLGIFWVQSYDLVIGGNIYVAILSIILTTIVFAKTIWERKIPKLIGLITLFFLCNVFLLRYFKGPIFDAFLVYLHPAIFIITGWTTYILFKWQKYVAILFFAILIFFTLVRDYQEIMYPTGYTSFISQQYMNQLVHAFPKSKFALFDYQEKSVTTSLPIVMYLMKANKTDDNGVNIGFITATQSALLQSYQKIKIAGSDTFFIVNLSKKNKFELEKSGWKFINPSTIHDSVVEWWRD